MKEDVYTKDQFLRAESYADKRDLLGALLKDGEMYSTKQVDSIVKAFLEREVN